MGYDCTNKLPKDIKVEDVVEFLMILGYEKYDTAHFYFWKEEDYKYYEGVSAHVHLGDENMLDVDTHTSVWRSKADSDFHNFTIKQLKKRFGGYFISDYGKNRYLKFGRVERIKAEAGCYNAHVRFNNALVKAFIYLDQRDTGGKIPEIKLSLIREMPILAESNWFIISNNLLVPFIVSCVEDYFKSTYIALLKYSPRKQAILRGARIHGDDLFSISEGMLSVEEAITRLMSFQNIGKVCEYFRELDKGLDLAGTLKKPYRRRKESLYDAIDRMLNQRHTLIHQNLMTIDYTTDLLQRDFHSIKAAIERVYKQLIKHYGWQPGFPY